MTLEGAVKGIENSINIETKVLPYSHFYLNFHGFISHITLSRPIKGFGEDFKKLKLKTEKSPYNPKPYWESSWESSLSDVPEGALGYLLYLRSGVFDQLSKHFENYSEKRLKKWQEGAFKQHNLYLRKLENLYWQGKEITNNFFNST